MKIIYALFRSSILEKLHTCLSEEVDLNPVYVIGDCDNINNVDFKKTIFHSIKDSRNGTPPCEYFYEYQSYIDDEFYEFMFKYTDMAISMMGRQSEDEWSFSYSERKNHFYYLCNYWYGVVTSVKPDIVLFRVIPHFASEYILFQVCKYHKITPITVVGTPFGYNYLTDNIENQSIVAREANNYKSSYVDEYIDNNLKTYSKALPWYMVDNLKHQSEALRVSHFFYSIIKDIARVIVFKNKKISETIKRTKNPIYSKKSQQSVFSFSLHKLNARISIYKNKYAYKRICSDITKLPEKYILFAPNYQPERSTMPDAGEFHDVLKILDVLSATIPASFKIVYKEHPMIFNYPGKIFFRGHLFRGEDFYKRAAQYHNIIFADYDIDTFRLVDNSVAVATATGTIAFQSSIRGKPVISFGNNWLTSCEAIHNYKNRSDLFEYLKDIDNNKNDKSVNIKIWKKYINTVCKYGFTEPSLLISDKNFCINNKGYLDSIILKINSIRGALCSKKR